MAEGRALTGVDPSLSKGSRYLSADLLEASFAGDAATLRRDARDCSASPGEGSRHHRLRSLTGLGFVVKHSALAPGTLAPSGLAC